VYAYKRRAYDSCHVFTLGYCFSLKNGTSDWYSDMPRPSPSDLVAKRGVEGAKLRVNYLGRENKKEVLENEGRWRDGATQWVSKWEERYINVSMGVRDLALSHLLFLDEEGG